jgi:hypothetical protein
VQTGIYTEWQFLVNKCKCSGYHCLFKFEKLGKQLKAAPDLLPFDSGPCVYLGPVLLFSAL